MKNDLAELQKLNRQELHELSAAANLDVRPGQDRAELLFELLKHRLTGEATGWGSGVLEVLPDGFGFLRSQHYSYEPSPHDIYVSPVQIQKLNLRTGHWITGPVRPPRSGENYLALLRVETVNGGDVAELWQRVPFDQMTPILPQQRLPLVGENATEDVRLVELLAPWGRGQRILVKSPPAAGRTLLLTHLAQAALTCDPQLYAILCLVDDRPEDVTEMRRQTGPDERREVLASTFDEPPARHTALAEMALAKARRMVEASRHVLLVCDSLTALVRAYNREVPHSGKILAAGLDAAALLLPKQLFGAARNTQEGGSLTVLATALTGTGSLIDEIIADEFAGKGNSDLVLDRQLAELHLYPALDVMRSGTRREDCLLEPQRVAQLRRLRTALEPLTPRARLEKLFELLAEHPTNDEVLDTLK